MRHNVSGKKLSRDMAHRKALLRNLSTSLVEYGSVETTLTKAKYVRPFVEKLVTKAKKGDQIAIRAVRKGLTREDMIRKLIEEIAPQFATRPGGYTRIKKLGRRAGDNAPMARIEWVLEKKRSAKRTKKEDKPLEVPAEETKTKAKKESAKKAPAKKKPAKKATTKKETK
ncbi:50S ribosomal protein L17 [candidate division WWE3 bacterium]|jgi:large subunit ribosomal protein L17|nr:50S ribosomal protein L17 [candidate division WWE3 bacterium]MBT7349514.1 50S ribosomal protein L17 [candidate division WWE3 bacterium]